MSCVKIWDEEVKQLAINCVTDSRLVEIIGKDKSQIKLSADEYGYAESVWKKHKDPYGMFYISQMIWQIEHALADNRPEQAEMAAHQVYCGISDSLLEKAFKGDVTNEEWGLRATLKEGLGKLLGIEKEKGRA